MNLINEPDGQLNHCYLEMQRPQNWSPEGQPEFPSQTSCEDDHLEISLFSCFTYKIVIVLGVFHTARSCVTTE